MPDRGDCPTGSRNMKTVFLFFVSLALAVSPLPVPTRAQTPESEIRSVVAHVLNEAAPATGRWGMWDAALQQFVPFRLEDVSNRLARTATLRLITHGWQAGMDRVLTALAPEIPTAWDERVALAHGQGFNAWMDILAGALQVAEPEAVILAFSWFEGAATANTI